MTVNLIENIGPIPKMKWVDVELLKIDGNYQRDVVPSIVQYIINNFNWMYFQPPTICPSSEGFYWVIDGQQRSRAAKLHPHISKIPCYIIDVPTTEEQAKAFITINQQRRSVNPVNLYWAGLTAKDPKYLAVERVLRQAGADVVPLLGTLGIKKTNSVGALVRLVKIHGEVIVGSVIRVLCEAKPTTSNVLRGSIITALVKLFRAETDINEERLITVLSSADLFDLNADALKIARSIGGDTSTHLRREIVKRYNHGLKKEEQLKE